MLNLVFVTRHTRAGHNGKDIVCPYCSHVTHVNHFAWSTLQCTHCLKDVPKLEYLTETKQTIGYRDMLNLSVIAIDS
jgi:ribosomal protein L37AE/L43A